MPPPDPRLNGATHHYNREEIIALIFSFYQFLTTLPSLGPEDIRYPPPGGWPDITKESLVFARSEPKTDEVVALLRHLPYIDMTLKKTGHDYCIADWTRPCDWRAGWNRWYDPNDEDGVFPSWVISLTYGESKVGHWIMLATSDETVSDYVRFKWEYPPNYPADDPRSWRDRLCIDETMTLAFKHEKWKNNYLRLEWMPPVTTKYVVFGDDEYGEEMKKIYREYGWPDNFRREDCRKALLEWDAK
ncbi:hypothetical protein VTN96DRAFT_2776 [Rasamsonia emersonii]